MLVKIKTNDDIREFAISGKMPQIMIHHFNAPIGAMDQAKQICLIQYKSGMKAELYDSEDGFISTSAIITEVDWNNWISAGLEVTPL